MRKSEQGRDHRGARGRALPGCDVCAALLKQRADARRVGDYGAALAYGRELENHPHPAAASR
ncbi:hypothetical protein [Streptomyces sp. NPDC006638]|uniref:hypothetical protein n=1 Tax=unclassified Streptomyces TaxID=2593676 RepID=UPI0033AC8C1F